MLSLKDIFRHHGMRRTHAVLHRIGHALDMTTSVEPIAEDLHYIGLLARTQNGFELTDAGRLALENLDAEAGHLLARDEILASAA
jgi:hypothetical protein